MERSQCRERAADDERGRAASENARRQNHGRRHRQRADGQRAAGRRSLLRRAEGRRMSALPSNLVDFTLAEARDAVHKKKVSSKELTTAFVKAVADARPLNAFVTETPQK